MSRHGPPGNDRRPTTTDAAGRTGQKSRAGASILSLDDITPLVANRAALRDRLERVAAEAERRGDVETAAISRYFLAGVAA